jgi:succinylglutamate desuccinylase
MVNPIVQERMKEFLAHLKLLTPHYSVSELFPYTYLISPQSGKTLRPPLPKEIPLTLFGLIHGNEVVGIQLLNEVLALLASRQVNLTFPLAVALGNYRAVEQGARYLEKDLNRSFGGAQGNAWEITRAAELTTVLSKTWYFVDFHQTSQPSLEPFFIFPYSRKNVQFARELSPTQAVVTHWHGGFSVDGMATDEYLTKIGGIGLTIETGQNGFSLYQESLGALTALKAIQVVEHHLRSHHKLPTYGPTPGIGDHNPLYTWAQVQEYPRDGEVTLRPGLLNFQAVSKGEELGLHNGSPLVATATGKLLFPKYLDPVIDRGRRPGELWRVITPVAYEDLPTEE